MSPVEKKWLNNFEKLTIYRQNNSNWPNYDKSNPLSEASKLSNFCQLQRKAYNENLLREDYLEKLLSINFNFEGRKDNWKETYERIKNVIITNNSVSIYKIGVNDYAWINRHWNLLNEGSLNDDKFKAIDKLNLSQYFPTWDERFESVKDWLNSYNEFPKYAIEPKLNSWLMSQRISFKNQTLSTEKAEKLKSIAFELVGLGTETDERVWKENFEDYKVFLKAKEEVSSLKIEPSLYYWVQAQRAVQAGNAAHRLPLTNWKVNLLNSIGFKWTQKEVLDEQWNKMFEALKKFLLQNEPSQIRYTDKSSSRLYTWIRKQIADYDKGKLIKNREKQLLELGLVFDEKSSSINFNEKIVKSFISKNPDDHNKKILIEELNKLLITDKPNEVQRRMEHRLQQKILFFNEEEFECAFCKKNYPRSFMVAAHIKKRKFCNLEERLDFNVVMPACRFGCDELFERGYISVKQGKIVDSRKTPTTIFIQQKIDLLLNNDCKYFSVATEKYFEAHYKLHNTTVMES